MAWPGSPCDPEKPRAGAETAPAAPESRNVAVLGGSLFGLSLGEELWQAYLPRYLTALGASGAAVGVFGSSKDLLDSLYQYPGGWLSDRLGPRRALLISTAVATTGYAVYAVAPSWPFVLAGLVAVMAWKAGAFPTTFSIVGDALPREHRAAAFAVQSVLVRLPRIISAPVGGVLIAAAGTVAGVRVACALTTAIGLVVLSIQYRFLRQHRPPVRGEAAAGPVFARMDGSLRRLLAADCLVRIGEGIAASFVVLFVTGPAGVSIAEYGVLYALQQAVAVAAYVPGARLAGLAGRGPVVALTFLFFAAFPLAIRWAASRPALVAAFIVGGLKELGEPARKSLIVDLAPQERRASAVGAYYAVRNLLVVPAGLTGGLLWQLAPHWPLEAAGFVSFAGLLVFLLKLPTTRRPTPNSNGNSQTANSQLNGNPKSGQRPAQLPTPNVQWPG